MKVAIVHPFVRARDGATYVIGKIAEHFDAKIYCVDYRPNDTFEMFKKVDVKILDFPFSFVLNILPKRLRDGIKAGILFYTSKLEDYDVIIASTSPSEWIRNRNFPVVWYCFAPNREAFDLYEWRMARRGILGKILFWISIQIFKLIEFSIVPKIECIITSSKNVQKNKIKKYLGRNSKAFYPVFEHKRFGKISYEKFFLYPSRITPEKRFEYAIEAFKKFKKIHESNGWKLILCGPIQDEDYYKKLYKMIDKDIKIYINVPEKKLKEFYERAYCILYTPINEDFGLVPLESFMAQKPCIAVNEGGPKESIDDGKDGFLVNNVGEMAEKMKFLAEKPQLVKKMGDHGKQKLQKKFSEGKFFSRIEDILRNVIG